MNIMIAGYYALNSAAGGIDQVNIVAVVNRKFFSIRAESQRFDLT